MDAHLTLARSLTHEIFQTERSASRQPRVEAQRLGDAPPARAMLAVAEHADEALATLQPLIEGYELLPHDQPGMAIGASFSTMRAGLADFFVDLERNYRGTLLGMRHGVDVVRLYRDVVGQKAEWQPIFAFCNKWLERRVPLVEACAEQLSWFALHPEVARKSASPVRGWLDGILPANLKTTAG
jgi:hypothetical protein